MQKVLVMGSGGREHALAWRLAQDIGKENVYVFPGNAGIRRAGFPTLSPAAKNKTAAAKLARKAHIGLVVIGPEMLLAEGFSNYLRSQGLLVFGPSQFASQLETSKVFAKEFMKRNGVPTAAFRVAQSAEGIKKILNAFSLPKVLKLDGLAAGKGVVLAHTQDDVREFCDRVWNSGEFGKGPHSVVVEELLEGTEISWIGLCDGRHFLPLPSATDYKRAFDGNAGPNTGGMGVISPSPYENPAVVEKITNDVVSKVLQGLVLEKFDYRGALYIGIMISPKGEPFVLEFNTRFGDPETQATLPRVQGNFYQMLAEVANGEAPKELKHDPSATAYIVAASEGYPGPYTKGKGISDTGVDSETGWLFYSGVSEEEGELVTSGGRVLGACGRGQELGQARQMAYDRLAKVTFEGRFFRTDIGKF